ncbi:helix-turn-helix transcriptional regulator [Shimia biformata]|uniref:helix-turn-helix transcriptional regulator n=1 Tax=Shimia biformata TaxID=1294299 RepID=UPI00194E76A2|nr:helix-turn-helix transcriptional regulator [Shimia biformata]
MNDFYDRGAAHAEIGAKDLAMIGAIARWCECIYSKTSLFDALNKVANGIGAEAVALSRVSRAHPDHAKVVAFDMLGTSQTPTPLNKSFARTLLTLYFDSAKPGSTWFKSMSPDIEDPALETFQNRRKLKELVVIPLETTEKHFDFIELHFSDRLMSRQQAVLNYVAEVLANSWRKRDPGTFTESILQNAPTTKDLNPTTPILSVENPARLSRAEYRVCLLLSHGKSVNRVQSELEICKSTVRSHLRNIYAKTETHDLGELLCKLVAKPEARLIAKAKKHVA